MLTIPNLPNKVNGVTWDSYVHNRNVFIVYDDQEIITYIYIPYSINGSYVQKLGQTSLVTKQIPLIMDAGDVMSATAGGQLSHIQLTTNGVDSLGINESENAVLEANLNIQTGMHR